MTGEPRPDVKAGVIAPPPLLAFAVLLAGLALDRLLPVGILERWPTGLRHGLAGAFGLWALWCLLRGRHALRRAATAVDAREPAGALATTGIYARTRHPLYQGLVLLLLALGFGAASLWVLVMAVPFARLVHTGAVLREERCLEARFGGAWRDYAARVPRYGMPL